MLETIGPVWDGNEVWLLVAGGATFAAFPQWYAVMLSGLYVPLLLVLVLLIVRVVSFEWHHRGSARWRRTWENVNTVASIGAPAVWGIALASLLAGLPIDDDQQLAGSLVDLIEPYTLLAGVAVVALFAFHGATFLALRTHGELRERSLAAARRLAPAAAGLGVVLLCSTVWIAIDRNDRDLLPGAVPAAIGTLALVAAVVSTRAAREGRAFAATATAIASVVVTWFTCLYPRVMVSSVDPANGLTVDGAASGSYTLTLMTIACAVLLPVVALYQVWTYRVFRGRVGVGPVPTSPADLLGPPRER
jgi:cytochrome d ubiquinol oxidase subunit II